jgi:malonyl CoA-acyl carrier protein transacylase
MVDAGLDRFVEAGPGNVLTNLGARSFQTAQFFSTSDAEGLEKVLAELADDGRE